MNVKNILEKLLKTSNISIEELNTLLVEYIKTETGKEPTMEELKDITNLIQRGIFNLNYAIDIILSKPDIYHIQVCKLFNKENILMQTYITEM